MLISNCVFACRTVVLLGELSDGDRDEVEGDQVALKEILHHVEGEDHKINGVILKDFVKKVTLNLLILIFYKASKIAPLYRRAIWKIISDRYCGRGGGSAYHSGMG